MIDLFETLLDIRHRFIQNRVLEYCFGAFLLDILVPKLIYRLLKFLEIYFLLFDSNEKESQVTPVHLINYFRRV